MSLIQIENLTFSYSDTLPVFDGVSLHLDSEWKTGLVGRNGTGKTTFLNLLRGKLKGEGVIRANLPFVYFPCAVLSEEIGAYEAALEAAPCAELWQLQREINLLGLSEEVLYRPFKTLSGGERTRLMLAALFSVEGYPLLDEPTDHLDGAGRALLARYLSGKRGFLVVSHDRAFLNACTDHTISFNRTGVEIVKGNYAVWREERDKCERANAAEKEKLEREKKRLEEATRRTAKWAEKAEEKKNNRGGALDSKYASIDRGFLGAKAAKLQKRASVAEKRQEEAKQSISALLKEFEEKGDVVFSPAVYYKKELFRLENITVQFGERMLFSGLELSLSAGERVALAGANGSGKSTLIKLIAGEFADFTGKRIISERLTISYVPQIVTLKGTLAEFAAEKGIEESYFKAMLSKIGFEERDFPRDMSAFSEGQKKKALVARALCERAHLYLFDEPLDYLDVTAREQLERALVNSGATVLFAEHDKAFAQAVATRVIDL